MNLIKKLCARFYDKIRETWNLLFIINVSSIKMKHTCSRCLWSDIEHRLNYSQDFHCPWIFLVWRPLELPGKRKSMAVNYRSDITLWKVGYFLIEIITIRESMALIGEIIFRARAGTCKYT